MRDVALYRTFAHRYDFRVLQELPSTEQDRYYFPGARTDGGRDGILLEVTPTGRRPWIGIFGFGDTGATGIFTMPNPSQLCVVSLGVAFLVDVELPMSWQEIAAHPVNDVRAVLEHGIVIFADDTNLIAYDADGIRWKSGRIAWDGMTILEVTRDQIVGQFDDFTSDGPKPFTVDLATGESSHRIED